MNYTTNMRKYETSLTRPANTDPYTAGDVVSHTTTPKSNIVFTVSDFDYPGQGAWIVGAYIASTNGSINVGMIDGFSLHLFNVAPAEINDSTAYTIPAHTGYIGQVDFDTMTDKGAFIWTAKYDITIPVVYSATEATIVANLVTKSGFTPTSGQIFKVGIVLAKS